MNMLTPTKAFGLRAAIFGAMALCIYGLMIAITLRHIEIVGGSAALDLRPSGFSKGDVELLFTALGAEGRAYYLTRQLPLDVLYPGLVAMTLASLFQFFGMRGVQLGVAKTGVYLSVAVALTDYAENIGIATMLMTWPELDETLVFATSMAAIAKASVTTLTMVLLLIVFVNWLVVRRRHQKAT